MAEQANTERELTVGEKAVGVSFNPSNNPDVDKVKRLSAELIDMLEEIHAIHEKPSWLRNVFRTAAFNAIIAAQMAVVKYITWRD